MAVFLVTEYIAGGNLKLKNASDWKEGGDLDQVLKIAIEVADVLAETHAKGIFHRDVKPSNVLLTKDGAAKLSNFGLAKPWGDASINEENRIVGIIACMSPEATKGLPPDSPSDMYSWRAPSQPNFQWSPHAILSSAIVHLARHGESRRALDELLKHRSSFSLASVQEHHLASNPDDMTHLLDGLRQARVPERD